MKKLTLVALTLLVAATASARNEHDDNWVGTMLVQHNKAIEIATLVAEKSSDPTVQSQAKSLLDTFKQDVAALTPLRDTSEDPAKFAGAVKVDLSSVQGKTGTELDKAFVKAMIEYHKGVLETSRLQMRNGSDFEARNLALTMAKRAQSEIKELQRWKPSRKAA